jgi:class 3 adenylate cyclase
MSAGRKVAAILVADMVGYSRLAGADEERTLARLKTLRSDLIDPAIAVHAGRVVKRTGDGAVVEFRSVVEAVRCAIEVQSGIAERNAGLAAGKRIEARVGVHLGDVVEESDGDLMGDGVNVAARLQSIGEPGGVCLSSAAYEQVRDKLHETFVDLGEQDLKNIARPVRVYALKLDRAPVAVASPKPHAGRLSWPWLAAAVVLAVVASAWFGRHAISPSPPLATPQASFPSKTALVGKVLGADNVGTHGQGFAAVYELNGTASGNGPDHKLHCFGILQGAAGAIVGERQYCVETDPDGDQVVWKVTPAPHPMSATKDLQSVSETIQGTGKYSGVSITTKATCQQSATGLMGWKLACDVTK